MRSGEPNVIASAELVLDPDGLAGHHEPKVKMVEAAVNYAEAGYYVVPLWPINNDRSCSCRHPACMPGKHPLGQLVPNGHKLATIDLTKIRQWWAEWPDAGIGIELAQSGILVVGPDSEEWLECFQNRGMPETFVVQTGGGAGHEHHYYRIPGGAPERRITKPGQYDLLSKGFVVAAPTLHQSGNRYSAVSSCPRADQLPIAPDWAIDELDPKRKVSRTRATGATSKLPARVGVPGTMGATKPSVSKQAIMLVNDTMYLPSILPLLRVPHDRKVRGAAFICPLGCGDTKASASLDQGDNGVIGVRTFHSCQGEREFWLLAEVYAGATTGCFKPLSKPELASWTLRLIRHASIIPCSISCLVPERSELSSADVRVFNAFCEVRSIARALGFDSVPFTRQFASAWTGMTQDEVRGAWTRIVGLNLVVCTKKYAGPNSPAEWNLVKTKKGTW